MGEIKKYRIEELIYSKLPRKMTLNQVCEYIHKHYGISPFTVYLHSKIKLSQKRTIGEEYLQKYAHFFGVSMRDVLNYSVAKTKTLDDCIKENDVNQIPSHFKLNGHV